MKALVGFSLSDGSATAGATFNAKDAKVDRLEAAGVAQRVKVDTKSGSAKPTAPADGSTGA